VEAREELVRLYWFPLYAFARARGVPREDAADAVQIFLARLFERNSFANLTVEGGRFHNFLRTGLKRELTSEHRADNSASRRPAGGFVYPDGVDPETRLANEPTGNYAGAVRIYQRGLEVAPDNVELLNSLGFSLFQQGNSKEAVVALEKALSVDPKHWKAHNNMALAAIDLGELELAEAHYRESLAIEPQPAIYNDLGFVLERQGLPDEAAEMYRMAVKLDPESASAHYNLGSLLARSGEYTEAESHLRRALKQNPDTQTYTGLGIVLWQLGRTDEAIRVAGREQDVGETVGLDAVALLGHVLAPRPQARLDVRDRHAERPTHRCAEDGGHRVSVDKDERSARPGEKLAPQASATPCERPTDSSKPSWDVAVGTQIAAGGSTCEPEVGLTEAELFEEGWDLLHLLTGGGEEIGIPALAQPEQHRGDLNQLTRGPEDDQDHAPAVCPSRWCTIIAKPRHMPAPWATAYRGVSAPNEATSNAERRVASARAEAAAALIAPTTGRSSGLRTDATTSPTLSGKNATTTGKNLDSGRPCPSRKTTPR
jgi:Flp pilus assembly protein TadD